MTPTANSIVARTEMVRLARIHPHPKNARRGNLEVIGESLRRNGQYRAVIANKRTGDILAGNHTYLAAQAIGWDTILTSWVDVDEEAATRILLVDNRASDVADYDVQALQDVLRDLPSDGGGYRDLEGTGYDKKSIEDLDALVAKLQSDADGQGDFNDPERNMATEFQCPHCGYEWSGKAKPDPENPDGAEPAVEGEPADRHLAAVPGDPEIDPAMDPQA